MYIIIYFLIMMIIKGSKKKSLIGFAIDMVRMYHAFSPENDYAALNAILLSACFSAVCGSAVRSSQA